MLIHGVNPGEEPDYIIVGLGNPGPRYEDTRHNIGFKVVDYLEKQCSVSNGIKRMRHSALIGKCVLDGYVVLFVKPQTYMNNSGMSVSEVMKFYKLPLSKLIVIFDDISLEPGNVRIRKSGSAGGHNGIKSIIEHLGTNEFARIKVGVGHKPEGWDLSNYVLGKISENDFKAISDKFEKIREALKTLFYYDIEKAMSLINSRGASKD